MLQFLVFWWGEDATAGYRATRLAKEKLALQGTTWRLDYSCKGGLVLVTNGSERPRSCPFALGTGVIVGTAFRNADGSFAEPVSSIGSEEAELISATHGSHLINCFWGGYVAFFQEDGRILRVLRDPSGALPCHTLVEEGITFAFSRFADVRSLLGSRPMPNMDYFRRGLLLPRLQRRDTAIDSVIEVLPGESRRLSGDDRRYLWNPYAFADEACGDSAREQANGLAASVRQAVSVMVRPYGSILHNLGGLDSSIVLSCMRSELPSVDVDCINYRMPDAASDERSFTRVMADWAGTGLHEVLYDLGAVDLSSLYSTELPVIPMRNSDCSSAAANLRELAQSSGSQALTFGVGGDNVFFALRHVVQAFDFAREHALGRSYLWIALCAARYGKMSLWRTIGGMIAERIRPRDPLFHVLNCAFQNVEYQDPWNPRSELVSLIPLLSQPVVEQCLRIPTWALALGGVDRGLARSAFAGAMPDTVRLRTTKSFPDALYETLIDRDMTYITEVVLEGRMVAEKIVRRDRLETALRERDGPEGICASTLLELFNQEKWLGACASC